MSSARMTGVAGMVQRALIGTDNPDAPKRMLEAGVETLCFAAKIAKDHPKEMTELTVALVSGNEVEALEVAKQLWEKPDVRESVTKLTEKRIGQFRENYGIGNNPSATETKVAEAASVGKHRDLNGVVADLFA